MPLEVGVSVIYSLVVVTKGLWSWFSFYYEHTVTWVHFTQAKG